MVFYKLSEKENRRRSRRQPAYAKNRRNKKRLFRQEKRERIRKPIQKLFKFGKVARKNNIKYEKEVIDLRHSVIIKNKTQNYHIKNATKKHSKRHNCCVPAKQQHKHCREQKKSNNNTVQTVSTAL